MKFFVCIIAAILMFAAASAQELTQEKAPLVTVVGYLRDSGCVHRFHEVVKPLPNDCLRMCVRGGSPLVVLTKDEHVYHPISNQMPDVDVRQKLLPFAGKLIRITGHVYDRGGSNALTVEGIEEVKE